MTTKEELRAQLQSMGVPQDRVVMVHSSLRSVGEVEGGGQGLLDVLIEHVTAKGGLLCIPTHTWRNLFRDKITLDMSIQENSLGAFSQIALEDPRGIRSEHPTHSVVVFGEANACRVLMAEEPQLTTPMPLESLHGKLYTMGGYVLLVGVGHNRNTYLHAVDEILDIPNRLSEEYLPVTVKTADGEVIQRQMRCHRTDFVGDVSLRFPKYETAFRYFGCIRDGFLGRAPTQLCDAIGMKETVEKIFSHADGKDPLSDEKPILQAWYCEK